MAKQKAKYIGWGFVKDIIREYGFSDSPKCRLKPFEREAVKVAVDDLQALVNGKERLKMLDLVFWKQSHTLQGAALSCHVSYETAIKWHSEFIESVGRNMGIF